MNAQRGRPVGFDGHGVEPSFLDQALGDASALLVELVRAVRRLPDENQGRVTNPTDQVVIIGLRQRQRARMIG